MKPKKEKVKKAMAKGKHGLPRQGFNKGKSPTNKDFTIISTSGKADAKIR
jgi:hypothetical protein